MIHSQSKANSVRRYAMVLLALEGLAATASAFADQLYESDRAYRMSGEATEARSLCLQEAKAALADRQGRSHEVKRNWKHPAVSKASATAPGKSASSP